VTDEIKGMLVYAEKDAKGFNTGWLLKIDYSDFKEHGHREELMWLEKRGHEIRPATAESLENTFKEIG
jgi:hypothetical protein